MPSYCLHLCRLIVFRIFGLCIHSNRTATPLGCFQTTQYYYLFLCYFYRQCAILGHLSANSDVAQLARDIEIKLNPGLPLSVHIMIMFFVTDVMGVACCAWAYGGCMLREGHGEGCLLLILEENKEAET